MNFGGKNTPEKEKKKSLQEAKEVCYCSKHNREYFCADGCPECNREGK